MSVCVPINYQLPSLLLAGSNPLQQKTMLYFYKKTERAIICTTELMGTKTIKINGKEFQARIQSDELKFAVLATGDFDFGDIPAGTKLPLKLTAQLVKDKDGNELKNLYWATPE